MQVDSAMEAHDNQKTAEATAPARGPSTTVDDDMFETEDENLRRALQMSMGVRARPAHAIIMTANYMQQLRLFDCGWHCWILSPHGHALTSERVDGVTFSRDRSS